MKRYRGAIISAGIGLVLTIIGVIQIVSSQSAVSACGTMIGQLAQGLYSNVMAHCDAARSEHAAGVGFIAISVGLYIVAALLVWRAKSKSDVIGPAPTNVGSI